MAPTPEILMRSRYTAFTQGNSKFIKGTWHPDTLPEDLAEDEPSNWIGLEIVEWGMDEEEIEGRG